MSIAALVGVALCVGIFLHVMMTQPSFDPPRHGLRGLKRARARAGEGVFKDLEPLLLWTAARVAPTLSQRRRRELTHAIMIAGEVWGLAPEEMVSLSLLGTLVGLALGGCYVALLGGGALFVLLFGAFGFMVPGLQLSALGSTRVRTIQRRIPHIVDLLVLSLGAGLDFTGAVRQVVERASDPESDVIEELGVVLEELKLGRTRRQALAQFAQRAPCDEVRDLVAATIQSEEQGTPLGAVLETQASTSRQRRSVRAEETAAKAGTAMVLPTTLLFATLLILILGPLMLKAMAYSTGG
jgi:tight adherence protein C